MKSVAFLSLAFLAITFAAPPSNKINVVVQPSEDGLREAFAQLLAHVDLDRLLTVVQELETRADGQEVLAYLRGDEFGAAIDAAQAEPAVDLLLTYIESNGFDEVREVLQYIAEIFGIPPRPPVQHWLTRPAAKLRSQAAPEDFLEVWDLLVSCIDVENLLATLLELLSSNKAVVALIEYIGSDEINDGYLRLKENPAIVAVADKLRENGVDVDSIIALIESILGLGPRNVNFRFATFQ